MIRSRHPDLGTEGNLKTLGYWASRYDIGPASLPDPQNYVDESWDPDERDLIVRYLEAGKKHAQWRGMSSCRFCDCRNGSACLTDGTYVWPQGLSHYLREHAVRPPPGVRGPRPVFRPVVKP